MRKNELKSFLKPADLLLIVPPFAATSIPSFGLHLLQSICRQNGLSVRVLYANFFYSRIIGNKLYHSIFLDNSLLLGERLFAANAFDLPPLKANMERINRDGWFPDHIWQGQKNSKKNKIPEVVFKYKKLLSSADWSHIEELSNQWLYTMAEQISKMQFPVIGCTTSSGSLTPAVALLKYIKKNNPDIVTIIGGTMCDEEMAEGILSLGSIIDYIYSGEGESTFPPFLKKILSGDLPEEKIIYGEVVKDLNKNPLPDYSEYFEQKKVLNIDQSPQESKNTSMILYETSRGCWYGNCTFCGLKAKKESYREKSPQKIIRDLKQLLHQNSGNTVWMIDNIMPKQYFKTLLPRLADEIPSLRMSYEIKANLTLEKMIILKQAGVTQIQPGIESLSSSLLKRMRKGVTVRENLALLRYARSLGIDVRWYLLYGLPGDQAYEYQEMIDLLPLISHLPPPRDLIPLIIHRFSEYHSTPEKFNISNLRPAEVYSDILPEHANVEKLVYQFAAEFNTESFLNPELIDTFWRQFEIWKDKWEFYKVFPLEFLLPVLHLEKQSNTQFVLHDTRGLPGNPQKTTINREQAALIITDHPANSPSNFHWALEAQLGIIIDSWFITFVTANPSLIKEFDKESRINEPS